jgi:hypothetical protein
MNTILHHHSWNLAGASQLSVRTPSRITSPYMRFDFWSDSSSELILILTKLHITDHLFLRLLRSGFYPGIHFLLGSFYTPRELSKRSTIFWCSGSLGGMFSGFLQTAAFTKLNGVHGLAGWRW